MKEALRYLIDKETLAADPELAEVMKADGDFAARSFFSANVESARFLDRAHGLIFDYVAKVREDITTPKGIQTTALRVADRAHFVRLMREFMVREGMVSGEEEFFGVNQKDIRDLRSEARLRLIFDTQVRQAYGYGKWKAGTSPRVMGAFPYARLVRDMTVSIPRLRHETNLGEIRHKLDPWWSDYINASDIGGFGVPWGPYGYNSGCDQEDVSLADATKDGKPPPAPPQNAKAPGFNDGLSAGTVTMEPSIKEALLKQLREAREGIKPRDPAALAVEAARNARMQALKRSLDKAVEYGDGARVEKIRQAIQRTTEEISAAVDALPKFEVKDDGDKIRMDGQ